MVAVLVVAILALLSLLLFIRIPSGEAWVRVLLDGSHGAIFAVVAMLVTSLLAGRRGSARANAWPDWPLYLMALATSITLGALVELLHGMTGRPPSLFDVMTDTAGALVGLGIWALATRPPAGMRGAASAAAVQIVIALGLAGLAFVLWRPMDVAIAYAVIGIGVPAAYVSPVSGLRTSTVSTPDRCAIVAIVELVVWLRV